MKHQESTGCVPWPALTNLSSHWSVCVSLSEPPWACVVRASMFKPSTYGTSTNPDVVVFLEARFRCPANPHTRVSRLWRGC